MTAQRESRDLVTPVPAVEQPEPFDPRDLPARPRAIRPGLRLNIRGRSVHLRRLRRPPTGVWRWLAILGPGLIAAAAGDEAAVERRVAALTGMVEAGALPAGPVVPAVCRAALAFAGQDYATCARILEPVAAEVVRIGGSGAQREMIEDTLLVALMRGGDTAKARALLDRRLHRRPSPRDARWHGLVTA
jgi:hypothetical protein